MKRLMLVMMVAGCDPDARDSGGTAVGNPGEARMTLARGLEVELVFADVLVDVVVLSPCGDGDALELVVGRPVSLLELDGVELPAGRWCHVGVLPGGPVVAEGLGPDDSSFELQLDVPEVFVSSGRGLEIDGQTVLLELGEPGWLDPVRLGLMPAELTIVDAGHPAHSELVDDVVTRSALYSDADANGVVDEEDEILAAGDGRVEELVVDDEEIVPDRCGCATARSVPWMLPWLALLGLRRRRRAGSYG